MAFLDEAGVGKLWSLFLTKLKGFAPMSHVEDTDIHVTKAEKETWNGLEDNIKSDVRLKKHLVASMTDSDNYNSESIVFGNDKFVVFAENSNNPFYSTDGFNWYKASSPVCGYKVVYGNGKFVAVESGSSKAAYSTDGITWTQATLPASASWRSLVYGNGIFVAFDISSSIAAYSTDGITWTQITLPCKTVKAVTYGNGKFVALSYSSSSGGAYSTDGITWVKTSGLIDSWESMIYGNGKFVAVAYSGGVAYSTDGITWTKITSPASVNWYSVTYGKGKFVAVAYGTTIAAYSIDGITWIQTSIPSSTWKTVTYGNGKFVAVAGRRQTSSVAISTNGIDWFTEVTYTDVQYSELSSETKEKIDGIKVKSSIPTSAWTSKSDGTYQATVNISQVSADEDSQRIEFIPYNASQQTVIDNGVRGASQNNGSINFVATTKPTSDISFYLIIKNY